MDKYEEEMFNFLTIEENLKGLIIAKNQFNNVRKGLIVNFWNRVRNNLSAYFIDSNRWEVKLDSNIFEQYSKLYLIDKSIYSIHTGHPLVFFCWESLAASYSYYGFCINRSLPEVDKSKVFDIISQERSSLKNHELSVYESSDLWPLLAGDRQFDLSNDQILLQIIPSKQEELAKKFADQLIDLFNLMQNSYERILMECESIKRHQLQYNVEKSV